MLLQEWMTAIEPSTKHLNILVVDDEAGTRSALDMVLRLAGHHAIFARDGDEALDVFDHAEARIDLIITDHAMARVSGLELVRKLRERGFKGEIVVLTAYAGTIEEDEYRNLEIAGIMEKPFDLIELRKWIECIHGAREDGVGLRATDFCWVRHR